MKRRASTVRRAPPTAARQPAPPASFVPPYPPSWFDRVMAGIDRLPGPYAAWYGAFGLALLALITLWRAVAGLPPFGGDLTQRAFSSFFAAVPPFLMHHLNRTASEAFSTFTPALRNPEEAPSLSYRLTTAPAVPSLLFSLGGAGFAIFLVVASPETQSFTDAIYGPPLAVFFFGSLNYFVNSHFAYRVIFQLRQVSRIYNRHARVRLADLRSHFALSRLTSRAAIAAILVLSGYMVGFAQIGSPALTLVILIPNMLLAVSAFVLPLLGAHRSLEAERDRAQREATLRMEAATRELHLVVEGGEYRRAPAVKDAITALDIELNRLARIPTWPWNPGTPRGVLAAVFLPVIIWLVQFALQRLLG